jgi:hypothetical protein
MPGTVLPSPDVTIHTVSNKQAQVNYVESHSMPLPSVVQSGLAVRTQDDLLNSLSSQITLAQSGGSKSGSRGAGKMAPVDLGVPHTEATVFSNDSLEVTPEELGIAN